MRRFSRKERKRRRKGRSLEDRSNTANTLNRYYLAIQMVLHLIEAAEHVQELDSRIAIFIEEAFAEGASHNTIADVFSSIHHFLPTPANGCPILGVYLGSGDGLRNHIKPPHSRVIMCLPWFHDASILHGLRWHACLLWVFSVFFGRVNFCNSLLAISCCLRTRVLCFLATPKPGIASTEENMSLLGTLSLC